MPPTHSTAHRAVVFGWVVAFASGCGKSVGGGAPSTTREANPDQPQRGGAGMSSTEPSAMGTSPDGLSDAGPSPAAPAGPPDSQAPVAPDAAVLEDAGPRDPADEEPTCTGEGGARRGDRCYDCYGCHFFEPGADVVCAYSEVECNDCYSPNQIELLGEATLGCRCPEGTDSLCVSSHQEDGTRLLTAMVCEQERWLDIADGPCWTPDAETACEHLAFHRLQAVEIVDECGSAATPCRPTVEFRRDRRYFWQKPDGAQGGSYDCEGLDLVLIQGDERVPIGSYDPDTQTLTWDGIEFR